jgi:hypothetical protein
MRLTIEEKKICNRYSQRRQDGLVHCSECPLVLDRNHCLCKSNVTKQEWERFKNERTC